MDIKELGERIRAAREAANERRKDAGLPTLTQTDIAKALNTSKKTVGEWERGESQPKSLYLIDYCTFLGISLDDMVGVKKNAFCSTL